MRTTTFRLISLFAAALSLGLLSSCAPRGASRSAPPVPSQADLAKMAQATQEALENNKDGEGTNWSVEGTNHLGTATPTRTFQNQAGAPCREFQQTVTIDGRTQAAYGTACRDADGNWTQTGYSGLGDVGPNGPYLGTRYRGYGYPPYYGHGPYYRYGPRVHYGFGFGIGHGHRHHRHKYRHYRHGRHGYRHHGRYPDR